MKKQSFLVTCTIVLLLTACAPLNSSQYSSFNEFTYQKEQPSFHFENDTLGIEGSWWWATSSRAMPKPSYLPRKIRKIVAPILEEQGEVLFATWLPQRQKYNQAGWLPVTRRDVRYKHKLIRPFYEIVTVTGHPFHPDRSRYRAAGKTNDYQFDLYFSAPKKKKNRYWMMQTIASGSNRYYDFICIMDTSYIKNKKAHDYQTSLFIEDTKRYFSEED